MPFTVMLPALVLLVLLLARLVIAWSRRRAVAV
jgi:hypothetical protein